MHRLRSLFDTCKSRPPFAPIALLVTLSWRGQVAAEKFQVWKLTVRDDRTATLACDDGNANVVFAKELEFTDFSLGEIKFCFLENTILLPSEY